MKTEVKTNIVQTHTFTFGKGEKSKAIEQCELLDLDIKSTTSTSVIATKTFTFKEWLEEVKAI